MTRSTHEDFRACRAIAAEAASRSSELMALGKVGVPSSGAASWSTRRICAVTPMRSVSPNAREEKGNFVALSGLSVRWVWGSSAARLKVLDDITEPGLPLWYSS
jgi:hypothetical protein